VTCVHVTYVCMLISHCNVSLRVESRVAHADRAVGPAVSVPAARSHVRHQSRVSGGGVCVCMCACVVLCTCDVVRSYDSGRCLIGDDMGLGKTVQGVLAARVVCVCTYCGVGM
jgi:hypothetical protein